jgi:hypothetical protein
MRVLFLGGSNTVIRNGYADHLTNLLAQSGIPRKAISNLAVGANSSVHGLQVLKSVPNPQNVDALFIEYSINDFDLVAKAGGSTWFGSVEGLVRFALSSNPDMKIFFILLGRKKDSHWQRAIHKNTKRIVAHYGASHSVHNIDIDAHLRAVARESGKVFTDFYTDNVHYRTTGVTETIARHIMSQIDLGRRKEGPKIMPASLMSNNFQNAVVFAASQFPELGTPQILANSRFRESVVRIGRDNVAKISLPGPLISLAFCSTQEACRAQVEEEGEVPILFDSLHDAVQRGAFPFLIKSVPFMWKCWRSTSYTPRQVTIRAVSNAAIPNGARYIPGQSMVSSDRSDGAFLLSYIMVYIAPPGRGDAVQTGVKV